MTTSSRRSCDEIRMAALARLDGEAADLDVPARSRRMRWVASRAGPSSSGSRTLHRDAGAGWTTRQLDVDLWRGLRPRLAASAPPVPAREASGRLLALTGALAAWRLAQLLLDCARAGRQLDCAARARRRGAVAAHRRSVCDSACLPINCQEKGASMNKTDPDVVLAQRYAYATVALVVGLLSFVNFLGFEKSILAIDPRAQGVGPGARAGAHRPKILGEGRHRHRRGADRAGRDDHPAEPRPHSEDHRSLPRAGGRDLTVRCP